MWHLAIDMGSRACKASAFSAGVVDALHFDGRDHLPSAVALPPGGSMLAGQEALRWGADHPGDLEQTPRRWLANGSTMVVGGRVVPVTSGLEAVGSAVVRAAATALGELPASVSYVVPAGWPDGAKALLAAAIGALGLPLRSCVDEPVAAVSGVVDDLPTGALVGVYDLGAGSLGTAVVRIGPNGPVLAGPPGGHQRMGGDVFDGRLRQLVDRRLAEIAPQLVTPLGQPPDQAWARAALAFADSARAAREELSSRDAVALAVPGTDQQVVVRRREFERVVAQEVRGTVDAFERTVLAAGVEPRALQLVIMVGGVSRTPLVRDELAARFGERLTIAHDPVRAGAVGLGRVVATDVDVADAGPSTGGGRAGSPRRWQLDASTTPTGQVLTSSPLESVAATGSGDLPGPRPGSMTMRAPAGLDTPAGHVAGAADPVAAARLPTAAVVVVAALALVAAVVVGAFLALLIVRLAGRVGPIGSVVLPGL